MAKSTNLNIACRVPHLPKARQLGERHLRRGDVRLKRAAVQQSKLVEWTRKHTTRTERGELLEHAIAPIDCCEEAWQGKEQEALKKIVSNECFRVY